MSSGLIIVLVLLGCGIFIVNLMEAVSIFAYGWFRGCCFPVPFHSSYRFISTRWELLLGLITLPGAIVVFFYISLHFIGSNLQYYEYKSL